MSGLGKLSDFGKTSEAPPVPEPPSAAAPTPEVLYKTPQPSSAQPTSSEGIDDGEYQTTALSARMAERYGPPVRDNILIPSLPASGLPTALDTVGDRPD
jgi:hypothetical protein